jgi:hypothetical protein
MFVVAKLRKKSVPEFQKKVLKLEVLGSGED